MLGKISGADSLLAFLGARKAQARTQAAAQSADQQQSPAAEALQRSREALNSLKQANASQGQQRKAAAKAKVERLKKELENLRLMSGGDPKAVARRAAQISRELAVAAKEYAAGSGRAGLGLGADASGADASGADAAAADAGAEQAAEGPEAQTDSAPQADSGEQADVARAEAQAAQSAAQAENKAETKAVEAKDPATAEEERRNKLAEGFRQQAGEIQQKGAEREEDTKFAAEVRRLHNMAKAIVNEQRRRAAQQNRDDPEMERFAKQVADDGADIQQTFSDGGAAAVLVPVVLQV
jgi:hypothetical protein